MPKFSGWTALGVIAVSLVISKYLATSNFFSPNQTPLLASETNADFLPTNTSKKIVEVNQQTELLERKTSELNRQTELLNQQTSELNRQTELLNQQTEALNKQTNNQDKQIAPELTEPSQPTRLPNVLEQEVYEQINAYRLSRHLPPLVLDARLSEQARTHSQAMASGQVPFGQQGFDLRSDAISLVIPYQKICENVAYNQGYPAPASAAVNSWLRNSERSVVDAALEYDLTGIGVATNIKGEYYFTQILLHRQ